MWENSETNLGALARALCAHAGRGGARSESGLPPTVDADIVAATAAANHYTAAAATGAAKYAATATTATAATAFATVQCFLPLRQLLAWTSGRRRVLTRAHASLEPIGSQQSAFVNGRRAEHRRSACYSTSPEEAPRQVPHQPNERTL